MKSYCHYSSSTRRVLAQRVSNTIRKILTGTRSWLAPTGMNQYGRSTKRCQTYHLEELPCRVKKPRLTPKASAEGISGLVSGKSRPVDFLRIVPDDAVGSENSAELPSPHWWELSSIVNKKSCASQIFIRDVNIEHCVRAV